jgi:N-methylhydantoinase A/oxoprolinase/acetone carboxylase beta subunit
MAESAPARPLYRIGIDVGGTFTKAVLVDNASHQVVGRYSVLTTHADPRGVAAGVVEVFRQVLAGSGVDPADVIFLAHSTTQATNALLEGDVASVGIVGMASRVEALLARGQTSIREVELAPGRRLAPVNRFLRTEELSETSVREVIADLAGQGVRVVVASSAFGVDDSAAEEMVARAATAAGLAATCGHEISKLYGLTVRTRTAVINASILPKMIDTADMTQASVREAGIAAPLMIMRGDGGVMDIHEMRRRPVMTMLSGPAASVAGALMHLRVSDGIYFEVGGTSTNIGVIRNGRPTVKHARVGGHETYVSSLDVRVLGVAGGSMVRMSSRRIVDVGPRSAHIAGLPYAAFASPERIEQPRLEPFCPRPGDPDDYVAVRCADGGRYALTTTCAANVLGCARPGMHAHGNPEAARRAMMPLAATLDLDIEATARTMLEVATDKLVPVVEDLIREYALDRDQAVLVGEGGGAGALIPFAAERLGLRYEISKDAEVISSIGVALALVRETVERVIPNPTPEALKAIRREALDAVVALGASPDGVEVTVEVDPRTQRVRATAMGACEMRATRQAGEVTEAEACGIAAASMGLAVPQLKMAAATSRIRVFQGLVEEKVWGLFRRRRAPVRAVDAQGVIRVQRSDAKVRQVPAARAADALRRFWTETTLYNGDSVIAPDMFVIVGARVVDLSGVVALDQALAVAEGEFDGLAPDAAVAMISIPGGQRA